MVQNRDIGTRYLYCNAMYCSGKEGDIGDIKENFDVNLRAVTDESVYPCFIHLLSSHISVINIFRGFRSAGCQNLRFPIEFSRYRYNSQCCS